ncbi:hypothetical protein [Escherichia coli]|nr:hypothetical protein [Escherichia coli]
MSKLMIVLVCCYPGGGGCFWEQKASLRASLDRANKSPAGSRRPSPC